MSCFVVLCLPALRNFLLLRVVFFSSLFRLGQDEESILRVSRFSGVFLFMMYCQLLVFQVREEIME